MSMLATVASEIAAAIKRLIEAHRNKEPRTQDPGEQVQVPLTEEELVRGLDAVANGLNWRGSIVDLQKTLGLPSDFGYRQKVIAKEMGMEDYTGTAEQNILMHKLVMDEVRTLGIPIPKAE